MSSSVESPENNQQTQYKLPTTLITSQPVIELQRLSLTPDPFDYRMRNFNNKQLTIQDYAQKEITFDHLQWKVGTPVNYIYEITPKKLMNYLKLRPLNTYFSFDNEFLVKFNTHQYMQGLLVLYFDPAPTVDYYSKFFGIEQDSLWAYFQFAHQLKFAGDRDVLNFSVPMIYPFNYFYPNTNRDIPIRDFLNDYPMGRWSMKEIIPLKTTSTVTEIPIMIVQKLKDVKYAGNRLAQATIT